MNGRIGSFAEHEKKPPLVLLAELLGLRFGLKEVCVR